MLTRIVKMHFTSEGITTFTLLFNKVYMQIRTQPGCQFLQLQQDIHNPSIFFTISKWESEADLNTYRNSLLFAQVWQSTKLLFAAKPEAWSLNCLYNIE